MQSAVLKRSIVIDGHKTSVSLEDAFWNGLKEIGDERHMTLSNLVAAIDAQRQHDNLSSAIRLFVLDFYRGQLSQAKEGHTRTQGVRLPTLSQRAIVSLGSSRTDEVEEDRSGA
jgi:predicted DNA-binding ribbon-helix-helix protein